jgi:hypothetical protein
VGIGPTIDRFLAVFGGSGAPGDGWWWRPGGTPAVASMSAEQWLGDANSVHETLWWMVEKE